MANISIVHTETHDETKPAGSRARSLGDDDIREFKRTIRERLAIDHEFVADETGETDVGIHKKITLKVSAADPTAYDDVGYLYIKTVSGREELFWEDDAGNVKQLTNVGKLKIAAAEIAAIGENVDFGAYEVRAQTLQSDVATGTKPITVASTTKCDNLNADLLDGIEANSTDLKPLGSASSKTAGTIYQAATDGIVCAFTNSTAATKTLTGYTDANTPPTTILNQAHDVPDVSSQVAIMFPVRKNEYWQVTVAGAGATATIFWIPLGA